MRMKNKNHTFMGVADLNFFLIRLVFYFSESNTYKLPEGTRITVF
ncbi:hypothetical protein HMPREF9554_00179 [Treponema phagedenis F0421]|nr:hypothetical protein HMPREF9554_00179 [Treponema phagedenis F0421]